MPTHLPCPTALQFPKVCFGDSIEATALPIITARRGVAGFYIILVELLVELPALMPSGATNAASHTVRNRCSVPISPWVQTCMGCLRSVEHSSCKE